MSSRTRNMLNRNRACCSRPIEIKTSCNGEKSSTTAENENSVLQNDTNTAGNKTLNAENTVSVCGVKNYRDNSKKNRNDVKRKFKKIRKPLPKLKRTEIFDDEENESKNDSKLLDNDEVSRSCGKKMVINAIKPKNAGGKFKKDQYLQHVESENDYEQVEKIKNDKYMSCHKEKIGNVLKVNSLKSAISDTRDKETHELPQNIQSDTNEINAINRHKIESSICNEKCNISAAPAFQMGSSTCAKQKQFHINKNLKCIRKPKNEIKTTKVELKQKKTFKKKMLQSKNSKKESKGCSENKKSTKMDIDTANVLDSLEKNQNCIMEIDKSEPATILQALVPLVSKNQITDSKGEFIRSGYDLAREMNEKRFLIFEEEKVQLSNKSLEEWIKEGQSKSMKLKALQNLKKRRESLKVALNLTKTCLEILQNILQDNPNENNIERHFGEFLYGNVNALALVHVPQFIHTIMLCRGCSRFSMKVRGMAEECYQKCHSMFPVPHESNFVATYMSEVLKNTPDSLDRAENIPFTYYGDLDNDGDF